LLQGDVGAGKTVVAALSMALVARSGYQAAMMAPTELLAQQHFETVSRILENSGLTVSLLTGSLNTEDRRRALDDLITGRTDILVGTHALISKDVQYRALAYVIVDEQHRFGVAQREALLEKGDSPDLLVMTATPIPRTLALTAYGDLDLSVLDEKPADRKAVRSALRTEKDRPKIYSFIRDEVETGNKVFIIYPLVEESIRTQMKAATKAYSELQNEILPDLAIGMVHGQMKKEDRDEIMGKFAEGELQVLVATTVVEVGIDVPEATVIIIEHAERFGLSQLHQLRGRVGRSDRQSFCVLLTDVEPESDAFKRLEKFVATSDGFRIAELDLELRGPGDLLGKRQSGMPVFKVANLLTDLNLILTAREYAGRLLANALPVSDEERTRLNRFIKRQRELETSSGIS
jgi:ATP-dependent DNA helicase RecG